MCTGRHSFLQDAGAGCSLLLGQGRESLNLGPSFVIGLHYFFKHSAQTPTNSGGFSFNIFNLLDLVGVKLKLHSRLISLNIY
jgi:hypothetical protein